MIGRERRLVQPGPVAPERSVSREGRGLVLEFDARPGANLLEAITTPLLAAGLEGAALTLEGGGLGPFAQVRPAHSSDGRHVAWYSETFRPEGISRLERGHATFGRRDGEPFLHVHAVWREADGARRGGHVLPAETRVAAPIRVRAWGAPGIAVVASEDAETGFALFHPVARAAPEPGSGPRLVMARIRPNEDATRAVEAVARTHGIRRAHLRGSVGSLVGALFESGAAVPDIATEAFFEGEVGPGPDGEPRARLGAVLADMAGRVHEGVLIPGANPVCITLELTLEETP